LPPKPESLATGLNQVNIARFLCDNATFLKSLIREAEVVRWRPFRADPCSSEPSKASLYLVCRSGHPWP